MRTKFGKSLVASGLIAALGLNVMAAGTAYADPGRDRDRDRGYGRDDSRYQHNNRGQSQVRWKSSRDSRSARTSDHDRRHDSGGGKSYQAKRHAPVRVVQRPVTVHKTVVVNRPVVVREKVVHAAPPPVRYAHPHGYYGPGPTRVVVVPERRRYRDVWVVRDYGHRYYGYGHYRRDDEAYKWLAFTAITVALINNFSEYQQRAYEDAQIRATTAPIGQTIQWNEGGAYGTVTATRDGTSSSNRYCREFQKTVTIGGRTEQAYGTACMQPDGAWEVVSDSNY